MRITSLVIIASVAALAFTAPAYAKNSETQKSDDKQASPSPSCRAYQKAADGSWQELPCQEMGSGKQPQPKSATKGSDNEVR